MNSLVCVLRKTFSRVFYNLYPKFKPRGPKLMAVSKISLLTFKLLFFSDYENFCQILLQRPFVWGSAGMLFTSRVTDDDLEIMTKLAQGHFEKVIIILKQLPRSMLLVFRCL